MKLTLRAPAKVNLYLQVLGKRADGYHLLESLFQTVSLYDTISITPSATDQLTCTHPAIPTDRRNLVWKAVDLYRKLTNFTQPLTIHIDKQIPSEAGLGGGSSDAATTLMGLAQLHGCAPSRSELAAASVSLGADVPFFFSSGTAICRGIGDEIEECAPTEPSTLTLVTPPYGVSTAAVYGALRAPYGRSGPTGNDLEEPALSLRPELRELKQTLLTCGFDHVQMTGSGSTFYCIGSGNPQLPPDHKLYRVSKVHHAS